MIESFFYEPGFSNQLKLLLRPTLVPQQRWQQKLQQNHKTGAKKVKNEGSKRQPLIHKILVHFSHFSQMLPHFLLLLLFLSLKTPIEKL
jgi:hypothetical protein